MALAIYKPGQGYWTRVLSAIGAGVLVLAGLGWLLGQLQVIQDESQRGIIQTVSAVVIILGFGGILYWIFNKPRIVDFMIATESEMRKVNWPTRRELIGSTWIVICGTFLFVAVLFVIDIFFAWFFAKIGILHAPL